MKKAGRAEQEELRRRHEQVFRPQSRASPPLLAPVPTPSRPGHTCQRPARAPRPPCSRRRPAGPRPPRSAHPSTSPPALSPGRPRGTRRKAGLTGSLRAGRRRGPVGRGPAPGVPLGGLPQVILEAHLPGFAATPEPPQAVGCASQKAPALPRERGQVVHAAAGQAPRRPTVSAETATRCSPTHAPKPTLGAVAPHASQEAGMGKGRGRPELGPGADHQGTRRRGKRSWTKVLKSFSCCFQTPVRAKLSL